MTMQEPEPYALVMLLGSGTPWSEVKATTPFLSWCTEVFKTKPPRNMEAGEQEAEYVTVFPTRQNHHPLLKMAEGISPRLNIGISAKTTNKWRSRPRTWSSS